jgi:peroxiredoxin
MRKLCVFVCGLAVTFASLLTRLEANASPLLIPASELDSKLPSTDGSRESLADYRGSAVLVHFFASWCGECLIEAPSLERLHRSLKDENFTVIGIAIDDTVAAARSLKERLNLTFPVLVDTDKELKRAFAVRGVPMTIMLDASGSVVSFNDPATGAPTKKILGPRPWDSAAARRSIREILHPSAGHDVALLGVPLRVEF